MNDTRLKLIELCDGSLTYRQLASELGKSKAYIEELVREMDLPRPPRDLSNKRRRTPEALLLIENIKKLCDGETSSAEIAVVLNCNPKYVQRIMKEFDLPRLPPVSPEGHRNSSFAGDRRIDQDGYVIPTARQRYMSKRGYYLQTHAKEAIDIVGKIVSYTEKPITDGSEPSLKVTRLSTTVLEFSMQIHYPPKWHTTVKLSAKHWIVAEAHKIDETPEGIVIYRGKAWYMPQIKSLGFSCKSLQIELKDVYIAEMAGVTSVGGSLSGVKGGVSNKIRRQADKRIWG